MTPKAKNPKPKQIGKIVMYIIGRQYYEADIARKERVYFQRDPDNEQYPDSILAINKTHEPIGFLARKNAEFLAPLIDDGKISLEGTVTAQPEKTFIPITANVYLHKKGKHIIEPIEAPSTEAEMIHEMVRAFFVNPGKMPGDEILKMRERLKKLVKENTLPETKLLVKMLPQIAKEKDEKFREQAASVLDGYFESLTCKAPIQFNNLSLFPVSSSSKSSVNYLTLDESLKKEQITITEVSEAGSVQELTVINQAEKPVLILDGEELVGAKQNRAVSITLVITAYSEVIIPVSCMERGRWSRPEKEFSAHHAAHMALRAQALGSAYESARETGTFRSCQSTVWKEVDRMQLDMGVISETDDLHEVYQTRAKEFKAWKKHLPCPRGCQGVLAAIDGEIIGGDIFDKPATMKKLWPKLLNSFTMEAIRRMNPESAKTQEKETSKTSKTSAQSFMENIRNGKRTTHKIAGAGINAEIKAGDGFASATIFGGQVVHVSMFSEHAESPIESPDAAEDHPQSRRRTTDTRFSIDEITPLRKQAARAREMPENDIPETWSISPVDPMDLVSVFPCLKVKDEYSLSAYQYRPKGNGNWKGFVFAIPRGTVLPSPPVHPEYEDIFLTPPKPEALDYFMVAIEGDGSPMSYLSASILQRELAEFGATGNWCYWTDTVIVGSDPWGEDSRHLFSSNPISSKDQWNFLLPEPDDWSPTVFITEEKVVVRFYVWSGSRSETIYLVHDTYLPGNYWFETKETVIAMGG